MDTETGAGPLHSLIPLADFKAILGLDDREDALSRYCLITATYTIEQYCRRSLFVHRHFERFEYAGDLLLSLREYPVLEIVALYALYHASEPEPVEPDFYTLLPELEPEGEEGLETGQDIPHTLRLSPALGQLPGLTAFKAVYRAGYGCGNAPADLASACLELAAWNMARYRGRRIGMTGNGKEGEHPKASMPENVRLLVEPYKRRTI
jgi:hypothetical protein